tara:strand:- start:246 stop:974 length:729 start_codon:yes stop_codon:yes gene_type:complete
MGRVSEIVKHLIIINAIFFIAASVPQLTALMYDLFSMHYPNNPDFILWQPISHMFMHGSPTHILFNMFGLWMFGTPLEQMWGKQKFIFFYISAGLGAVLIQTLVYHFDVISATNFLLERNVSEIEINKILYEKNYIPDQDVVLDGAQSARAKMVGASGALYGILVAFAMLFPNVQLMLLFPPIPIKAKILVPILISIDLFSGFSAKFSMGPIAHFAHVGGALTGFIMMWYWKKNQFNNKRWN